LKAENVPVLLSLNFPKRTTAASPEADPETLEVLRLRAETPKGPGRLAQAGVRFAFASDGARTPADYFTNAGKAVEDGLTKDAAVRAMTLGSAEILGVADRLGSIDKGKIADLAVVKGDLFGKDRFVNYVFVDGKLYEQKAPPPRREGGRNGQANTAAAANPAVANVGGSYSITIDVPGQTLTGTLNLVQQGTILSGELQTQLGVTQIKEGKVTAEGFTFQGSVEYAGSTIQIIVKGTVNGNQISGSIDSNQGVVPFSGTRVP
jgi:hypothetical protein